MEKDVHDLSEKNDHARPAGEGSKLAWSKPRIRVLEIAFTLTGFGPTGTQGREEDADSPNTDGYSPDS